MTFIEWAQRRLIAQGFNPGSPDGIWGRNTRAAVLAFQRGRGLPVTGTLNAATVTMLRQPPGAAPGAAPEPAGPGPDLLDRFPWMALALRKLGLHEGRDNADLRKFLKSDGKTLGDPAQLPWCGDFVETCIAVTLPETPLPGNPYLARNWLKFGHDVDPCFGSVLVFWRGSRSGISGHVGFYYSEDDDVFHVLGGNQSNKVSIASIRKDRLLGARLPLEAGPYPRQVVASAADFKLTTNEA
ncbi:NlpC/P60 family protein [Mangrovicoccus algicola]|uniref:Peptidoglycan-binding protein n=1 Tax=Mangrovicoccus algicola TaxID=2771008 RepID=A0A8J7CY61_9RHOB|nr:peptidoglycan-binding protein [Mangrovicoccus algicola]MBE3639327.1 peptidoglycan-binding protein [Mangrovicoccus algicola]